MSTPFSLVLGGGSARGLAHIGVVRRLESLGVRPNCIIGTSMGSIVGAFYACGYTSREMEQVIADIDIVNLLDFDMKNGGIKGEKVLEVLKKYIGEKTFGDTNIPLQVIATNFHTGEKHIFQDGKIVDALRASISIPGIFSPYELNGSTYIDGGMVANLAIENAPLNKKTIAISVQIPVEKRLVQEKKGFLNLDRPITNTYFILRDALTIMIIQNELQSIRSRSDVYFSRLGAPSIDYHEFDKYKDLIQAGYDLSGGIGEYLKKKPGFFKKFIKIKS